MEIKISKSLILGLMMSILYLSGLAQPYPEKGKPMPDFVLRNIEYYPRKKATLADFKGKWLMLDFWNKNCGACVMAFPHNNGLQKEFGDKLQVMQVGVEDPEHEIRPMYAKFREKEHLTMACAFDSTLANRFDIGTCPYIILIDDKGMVRAITTQLSANEIKDFFAGKGEVPPLNKAYRTHEDAPDNLIAYDSAKPFLIKDNGAKEEDFIFRSVLAKWKPGLHDFSRVTSVRASTGTGKFESLGIDLRTLYQCAYFSDTYWGGKDSTGAIGRYSSDLILEIKDSSSFQSSYKTGQNIYSYSLIMPKQGCTVERMEAAMRRDLQTYFGYTAVIETRKCPYLKLIARPGGKEKLQTKGGPPFWQGTPKSASFTARNYPFKNLLDIIRSSLRSNVVIDETGITGNIDISMDCIPCNPENIRKSLKVLGLELVPAEKEMKVLVIKDAPVQSN